MIPNYVPKSHQETWKKLYSEYGGDEPGLIAANTWLINHYPTQQTAVARTSNAVEKIVLEQDETTEFISRTEDGEEYISFKLADVNRDKFGVQWNERVLRTWEQMINSGKVLVGDIDHDYYNKLVNSNLTDEEIKEMFNDKKGIAKSVKAIYDKGKLWVKALIDKRYKKLIEKAKGVSMEALITKDENGNVKDGDLLGFTFGVKENPVIEGSEIHGIGT